MNKQNYMKSRVESQFSRREQENRAQLVSISNSLVQRALQLNQRITEASTHSSPTLGTTASWQHDLQSISSEISLLQRTLDSISTTRQFWDSFSVLTQNYNQQQQFSGQNNRSRRRNRRGQQQKQVVVQPARENTDSGSSESDRGGSRDRENSTQNNRQDYGSTSASAN